MEVKNVQKAGKNLVIHVTILSYWSWVKTEKTLELTA